MLVWWLPLALPGSAPWAARLLFTAPAAVQVGNMTLDAAFWGPPEQMTAATMPRPAYVVETSSGASDLAGSMAGALAASAMAVRQYGNNASAHDAYLSAAVALYNAVQHPRSRWAHAARSAASCAAGHAPCRQCLVPCWACASQPQSRSSSR